MEPAAGASTGSLQSDPRIENALPAGRLRRARRPGCRGSARPDAPHRPARMGTHQPHRRLSLGRRRPAQARPAQAAARKAVAAGGVGSASVRRIPCAASGFSGRPGPSGCPMPDRGSRCAGSSGKPCAHPWPPRSRPPPRPPSIARRQRPAGRGRSRRRRSSRSGRAARPCPRSSLSSPGRIELRNPSLARKPAMTAPAAARPYTTTRDTTWRH